MPAKTLEAQVRHQPAVAIVDLHGEINAFAEDRLNAAYAEAESRAPDLILLNFSDVDYINSTGIDRQALAGRWGISLTPRFLR